jgi:hypothetical protein
VPHCGRSCVWSCWVRHRVGGRGTWEWWARRRQRGRGDVQGIRRAAWVRDASAPPPPASSSQRPHRWCERRTTAFPEAGGMRCRERVLALLLLVCATVPHAHAAKVLA